MKSQAMKDIDEIRRENLRQIEDELGGPSSAAKALNMSVAQFANLRDGAKDSKTQKPRGMRKETARRIEAGAGKPPGWLDADHRTGTSPASQNVLSLPRAEQEDTDIVIPQYDTGGSMGRGIVLQEQPGVIKEWRVSEDWLRLNVHRITSPRNLAIVTGFGDSMRGMFNPGDPLLVDTGVKQFDGDAVYFFRVEEEGFVKRLQRVPGEGILVISENKAYRDWTIKPGMDFEVFAKVVKVWKGEDF